MKIEKVEHSIYKEWNKAKEQYKEMKLPLLVDRWQYRYSTGKGTISLIKLLNYFNDNKDFWEIYCLDGNLFEDVERFDTKTEAEVRIKELLE